MAAVEGEVRRNMWGHEYRTASADCAAALDAYYAHTMAFGRGRGPTVLRAAAVDPSCVLASTLATPWDPARAAALLAAAAGVRLVGCCNELNAAYTADGYARARGGGVGACAVTFTVGGLSVINVVAGAFSENLPVVCIVGGPNSNDYGSNRILHHTIGLPDFTQELSYVDAILTIPKGSLFPMCGMNLAFDRELIGPAMYFGLMGDGHPFGRYDDMWAGWCTKAHPPGAVNVQIYGLIKEWTAWDIAGRVAFAFFDIFA